MNDLMLFNNPDFGEVRTLAENGAVLFCGTDVARALGYKSPKDAVSTHCRGAVKRRLTDSIGREQETSFIPESDLSSIQNLVAEFSAILSLPFL